MKPLALLLACLFVGHAYANEPLELCNNTNLPSADRITACQYLIQGLEELYEADPNLIPYHLDSAYLNLATLHYGLTISGNAKKHAELVVLYARLSLAASEDLLRRAAGRSPESEVAKLYKSRLIRCSQTAKGLILIGEAKYLLEDYLGSIEALQAAKEICPDDKMKVDLADSWINSSRAKLE